MHLFFLQHNDSKSLEMAIVYGWNVSSTKEHSITTRITSKIHLVSSQQWNAVTAMILKPSLLCFFKLSQNCAPMSHERKVAHTIPTIAPEALRRVCHHMQETMGALIEFSYNHNLGYYKPSHHCTWSPPYHYMELPFTRDISEHVVVKHIRW